MGLVPVFVLLQTTAVIHLRFYVVLFPVLAVSATYIARFLLRESRRTKEQQY